MKQGSQEWFEARLGKATASRIADIVGKTRSGSYREARGDYMVDLLVERLTGEVAEHYTSRAMEWGIEQEPFAISEYEMVSGNMVEAVGFIEHPTIPMGGASPDGLVGDAGLIEVKCPNTKTHLKTLLGAEIDPKYMLQMQWQMDCTGSEWCDFVSYDPRLKEEHLILAIRQVDRDAEMIEEVRAEVTLFLEQLESLQNKLDALRG